MSSPDLELVYVSDPLCSWCWGFTPTLEALRERTTLPLRLVLGGLAIGNNARVMTDQMAAFIGHHWEQVTAMTGQPFDHKVLERRGWRYDSQLPCQAVVAMRGINPEAAFKLLERIHRAFYVEGVDVSDPEAYRALAGPITEDIDAFMAALTSQETITSTFKDFAESRNMGVMGFPSLVLVSEGEKRFVTRGYTPIGEVEAMLRGHLGQLNVEDVEGAFCGIDGEGC